MNTSAIKTNHAFQLDQIKLLDLCHHIHKHAEELYLTLSSQQQDDRIIARLWGELAVDKCNHADAFKMAGRLKGTVLREIKGTPDAAVRFLEKMKHAGKVAKQNPLAITDALKFALKMEEGLEKFHILHVATFYREKDLTLLTSSLKKRNEIEQIITEKYVNMTMLD